MSDALFTEVEHLRRALEGGNTDLCLSIAKRVQRQSRLLVQALAQERDDKLQPGGTSE